MHPVKLCDDLTFQRAGNVVQLTCSEPALPTDASNLVHRAASAFLERAGIRDGVRIHLQKHIPMAAGLGGGSGNAATTLRALNELFEHPLSSPALEEIAATLGSDVPFFLQDSPALATGRGEKIQPLGRFPALEQCAFLLVHPGFGIATAWAYQQLGKFPEALNGTTGRAHRLIANLQSGDLRRGCRELYNSLEAPALFKFPWLAVLQEFLREHGAWGTLMSGSGSTTFAITPDVCGAAELEDRVKEKFGRCWTAVVPV